MCQKINEYVADKLFSEEALQAIDTLTHYSKKLFCLYNLLRHRRLVVCDITYEAAFLSALTSGLGSYSLGLFETSAFLLSQAEKVQREYNVC